jgi:hypothetical protein
MRPELMPAIEALEQELMTLESKANELRSAINTLCRHAGVPTRHAEGIQTAANGMTLSQIKPDTFYGKRMQTAAREFMEMRKAAGQGPAKPRDVYEALRDGGFQFETQDEDTALVSLRNTLRKNSQTFHKLPNGQYGLRAWYPNAKPAKDDESDSPPSAAKSTGKRAVKRSRKAAKSQKPKPVPEQKPLQEAAVVAGPPATVEAKAAARGFVIDLLSTGSPLGIKAMVEKAAERHFAVEGKSVGRALQGALLGLKSQGVADYQDGAWKLVKQAAEEKPG